MLYIALAAALAALSAARLKLALFARVGSGAFVRVGFAPVDGRIALRRAQRHSKKRKKIKPPSAALIHAGLKAARYLLPRIQLEQLRVLGHVSAQDAARTALLTGGARALIGLTTALLRPRQTRIALNPDFSQNQAHAICFGMLSLRLGHIICAGAIGAWNYLRERLNQWISTRLKTS